MKSRSIKYFRKRKSDRKRTKFHKSIMSKGNIFIGNCQPQFDLLNNFTMGTVERRQSDDAVDSFKMYFNVTCDYPISTMGMQP